jgi:S-adenosylmethionine hydrolase
MYILNKTILLQAVNHKIMITLLSDWKLRDPYIGIFKGQLLKQLPNEQIVDITHNLEMFNPSQTAFLLKNSFDFFPAKTIHIVLAGLTFSAETKPVLVVHNGHFFLGEDTGVFSMMFSNDNNWEAYQYKGTLSLSITEKLVTMTSWVCQETYKTNTEQ